MTTAVLKRAPTRSIPASLSKQNLIDQANALAEWLAGLVIPLGRWFVHLTAPARDWVRSIEWEADLAENIGSARWFRGFGLMLGLAVFALSFWPDFSAVEAAPTISDARTRSEFRSQMIRPIVMGSDMGRHVGPTQQVVPLAAAPERPTVQFTATLGQGDSFERMLQRAGVGSSEAADVTRMIASAVPLADIEAGTRVDITLGSRTSPVQPRPLDKMDFRARFDMNLGVERHGDRLALALHPIKVDATPLRIRGVVGSSLYRSARAAGAPVTAIQQYLQALDSHLSLESDILPTDEFDFVVSYKRSAAGEKEIGALLYAGLERNGKPRTELVRWGSDGQLYDASGLGQQQQQYSTGMAAPVYGHLTSGYGLRRHPILGYTRMHSGVDFGAAWGSPIYAVSDGIVSYAGRHGGHGNYVRLEHGGGFATGYAHMSRIATAYGMRVRRGQVIGYVGSSGLSTGPHLHYEVYQNGRTINPLGVRFSAPAQVDPGQLASFRARVEQLKLIEPGAALVSLAMKQAVTTSPTREIDRLGGGDATQSASSN